MDSQENPAEALTRFVTQLLPESEQIALELEALQSIYGSEAIRIWPQVPSAKTGAIRYEVLTTLGTPFEDIPISVLVSLSGSYPSSSPPQLQLLSKYVGAFGVDSDLFASIIRTFISSTSGVKWNKEDVAVFDGIESVRERCSQWYRDKTTSEKVTDVSQGHQGENPDKPAEGIQLPPAVSLPVGIEIVEAEPIIDRKSSFVGRACRIDSPSQVSLILSHLLSDKRISRAAHPVINAWRCSINGVMHQDNDDDGETAAGGRLAHLLQILEIDHVLVIVTRYFGGIHLGPDRFKHINQAARNALERGGFLDSPDEAKQGKGKARKRM